VDTLAKRLCAGGLHGGKPVLQHGGEDRHHLPIAVIGERTFIVSDKRSLAQLAPHLLQR
jgi:hypothetical protein